MEGKGGMKWMDVSEMSGEEKGRRERGEGRGVEDRVWGGKGYDWEERGGK